MRGRTRRRGAALLALGGWLLAAPLAAAHTTATGLATVTVDGGQVGYRLTVPLDAIDPAAAAILYRASNGDQASAEAVAALIREHVSLRRAGEDCRAGRVRIQGSDLGAARVVLETRFTCPERPGDLVLSESWPAALGAHYATIVDVREGESSHQLVLDAKQSAATVSRFAAEPAPAGWLGFVRLGIWHIIAGIDHLLFVGALMLGSRSLMGMLGVITAFTVAHSITLAVATLGLLRIPAAIVEPLIAASIVAMAGEVMLGLGPRLRWLITFGFGLVHGFGFATVLQDLSLSGWPLAHALVGFNIGVELGQAGVILVVAPLLFHARKRLGRAWVMHAPAAAIGLCGAVWTIERLLP